MNPIQMKDRIDYHTDKVRAPRWYIDTNYVPALNIAVSDFIDDRYGNIKKAQKNYAFEVSQSIKDDLRTLVNEILLVPSVTGVLTLPANYHHEVGLRVVINGKTVPSIPVTHNELNILSENSNTRPTPEFPVHYEDVNGITVKYGGYGTFTQAYLSLLKLPIDILMVADPANRTQLLRIVSPGPIVIGSRYYVTAATTHNAVPYGIGETFVAVNTVIAGGSVSLIVNCELPEYTHEEICKMAAASLVARAQNMLKNKVLTDDLEKN